LYVQNLFQDDRRETILASAEKDVDKHIDNFKLVFAPIIQENLKKCTIDYFD
jgi:hypothetical protein